MNDDYGLADWLYLVSAFLNSRNTNVVYENNAYKV